MPTYQYRCNECGKSFERTETITEYEAATVRCPKCDSKKATQVPGRVHVVTSKKARVRRSLSDFFLSVYEPNHSRMRARIDRRSLTRLSPIRLSPIGGSFVHPIRSVLSLTSSPQATTRASQGLVSRFTSLANRPKPTLSGSANSDAATTRTESPSRTAPGAY